MTVRAELDPALKDTIERDGFAVIEDALESDLVEELLQALSAVSGGLREQGVHDRGGVYAIRNLFDLVPRAKSALEAPVVREIAGAVLGRDAFCVRGLFLGKTPRLNWKVPWHQDATIVVKERAEVTGFGPWSMKAGLQHVMAPPGTLSSMLTMKLHLDDCGEAEGAMRVIPSSHQYGRLPEDSIGQFTRYDVTSCAVGRGGLMAMRPLLLHASGAAARPRSRRIIQLDFCARRLPLPLEWREAHKIF